MQSWLCLYEKSQAGSTTSIVRARDPVQGWDQAHQGPATEGKAKQEVAAAGLAEMCQRVQDLGERFYPNEAISSSTLH